MRTARTLVAGAALTACLALAPAAYATGAVNAYDPSGSGSSSSSSHGSGSSSSSSHGSGSSGDSSSSSSSSEHGDGNDPHHPHGGMHTGGGWMAGDNGSGLAAGSVLLLGGVGAGAFVLRRRRSAGAVA